MKNFKIRDLYSIQPGQKIIVHWCKDDDPEDCRLNYDALEVVEVENHSLLCEDGWEFDLKDGLWNDMTIDGNELELGGRGIARFYYHEEL